MDWLDKTNIIYFVLSLFVQRKNQRKGAGNEKFNLFVFSLHEALRAPPKRLNFTPFPVCHRAFDFWFQMAPKLSAALNFLWLL
jgi:hypothetical protein